MKRFRRGLMNRCKAGGVFVTADAKFENAVLTEDFLIYLEITRRCVCQNEMVTAYG
jgi:hypothetical protein